jgi:hypothetical protein
MIFADEGLRTHRFNYCYRRRRCSFTTFRFSRGAMARGNTESNWNTVIVGAF